MIQQRKKWVQLQRSGLDMSRLVLIDETWIKTNIVPHYDQGRKQCRLYGCTPRGHRSTMTFIGALRHNERIAAFVFDGLMNGAYFTAYVGQILVRHLKSGDIAVMDNVNFQKSEKVRNLIHQAGASILSCYLIYMT